MNIKCGLCGKDIVVADGWTSVSSIGRFLIEKLAESAG